MLKSSRYIILLASLFLFAAAQAQEKTKTTSKPKDQKQTASKTEKKETKTETPGIKWISFTEAVELNKKEPRKIIIDVYTQWCGWCKVMDKSTYTDTAIINYVNKHYYAVKLDAEMKDTVIFNGVTFVNPSPTQARSAHQLAQSLLSGKMSYPTTVLLDETFHLLMQPLPGYYNAQQMEPFLVFFGDEKFKTTNWDDFSKTFKGNASPPPQQQQQVAPH